MNPDQIAAIFFIGFMAALIPMLFLLGMCWRLVKDLEGFLDDAHKNNLETLDKWEANSKWWAAHVKQIHALYQVELQSRDNSGEEWKN
jgi:hypothetical protein